ncbi:MAG TPA: PilN domain-containing protein [Clostridiales bacterium]|nr:PilN domain-containing protein [Clostridiales bacterium]
MKEINLLPPEYRKKPKTARNIIIAAIFLILLLPIARFAFMEPMNAKKQAEQLLKSYQGKIAEGSDLEDNHAQDLNYLEELEARLLEFNEIEEGTPLYWQNMLDILVKYLPSDTILNDFNCSNNSILISGTAKSDRDSAEYMRNLNSSGFFSDVCMEKIVYKNNDEITFHLRCNIVKKAAGSNIQ